MEELTLEQLNSEYESLAGRKDGNGNRTAGKVQELSGRLADAQKALDESNEKLSKATLDYDAAKQRVEKLTETLARVKEDGVMSSESIASIEKDLRSAESAMEIAEKIKDSARIEQVEKVAVFNLIKTDAQEANDRMNLILASFAADEKINSALVNELEIDYSDRISVSENRKNELDSLKTKISEDPKIQTQVSELKELLEKFENDKSGVTPESVTKLNELGVKIKAKRKAIRARLFNEFGLKGSKIDSAEIDAMATQRDAQGRIVVAEIDRRIEEENAVIASIESDRDSTLEVMGLTLEMAKDLENGSSEFQTLSQEVETLTAEINTAKQQKADSEKRLEEIQGEKQKLEQELTSLNVSNPNSDEIQKLEQELAAIKAEVGTEVDNPKYIEITKKIEELQEQLKNGNTAQVETQEYIDASENLEAAKKRLQEEKENPTIPFIGAPNNSDRIEENPEYKKLENDEKDANDELNGIIDNARESDEDAKKLYSELEQAEREASDASSKVLQLTIEEDEKYDELTKEYVGIEVYPGLETNGSEVKIKFDEYRKAELLVRQMMIACQKEPTIENVERLKTAIAGYQNATNAFRSALMESNPEVSKEPSNEAMHNYLLGVIGDELEEGITIDDAYNIKNVENRIAILKAQYKKSDDIEFVEKFEATSITLEKRLNDILKGNLDESALDQAIIQHAGSLSEFDEDSKKEVLEVLKGTGVPSADTKLPFWKRLFAPRMPKQKVQYAFPENEVPDSYQEYIEASEKRSLAMDDLHEKGLAVDDKKTKYEARIDEILTDDQKARRDELKTRIDGIKAKLKTTPKEINRTKLEGLEAAVTAAEEKLANTTRYEPTIDKDAISRQINDYEDQLKGIEPKIMDTSDRDSRATEKQKELDAVRASNPNASRIAEIKDLLTSLGKDENDENAKREEAEKALKEKEPRLVGKLSRFNLLKSVRKQFENVRNLIRIKDSNRIKDNRTPVARSLADDGKDNAIEAARKKEEELEL